MVGESQQQPHPVLLLLLLLLLLLCCRCAQFFELWCHPKLYRTQMCRDGAACSRVVCFFAHTVQQLRLPSERLPPLSGEEAGLLAPQAAADSEAKSASSADLDPTAEAVAAAAAAASAAEGCVGQVNGSSSSNQGGIPTGPQIVPWLRAPQQANVLLPDLPIDDVKYSGSVALYAHNKQQQQQQYVMVPHVNWQAFPASFEAATDDPCNRSTQLYNCSMHLFNVTSSDAFAFSTSDLLAAQCASSSTAAAASSYMAAGNSTSFAASSSSSSRLQQVLSPQPGSAGSALASRHVGSFSAGRSISSRYSSSSLATLQEIQQNMAAQQQQQKQHHHHAGFMQVVSMPNVDQSFSQRPAQDNSMPASFSAGGNIDAAAWHAAAAAAADIEPVAAAAAAGSGVDAAAAAAQLSLGTAVSHLAAAIAAVGAAAAAAQ
jgi:hypothetical protein